MHCDVLHGDVRSLADRGRLDDVLYDRRQDNFLNRNVGRLARWDDDRRMGDNRLRRRSTTDALDGSARCPLCARSCGADADVGGVIVGRALLVRVNPSSEAVLVGHVAHDPL